MKRTQLERRTPLSRSSSGLDRSGSGLTARSELRSTTPLKRGSFTAASAEQKAKVVREGSRVIVEPFDWDAPIDAAHIVSRALGGCDDQLCTCPLPRPIHEAYDRGEFDLLPHLSRAEQAHAVEHLGILGALKRTTGETYIPQSEGDQL